MEQHSPVSGTPNKGGRPRKLNPDEATLKQLRGLGQIQATVREGAAFFGVALQTFEDFLDLPGVREAFEQGKGKGKISLRRQQFQLAEKNAAMAIWLGKQYLEQHDRHEFTGKDGGPIQYADLSAVSDDDLRRLNEVLRGTLLASGSGAGATDQGRAGA